MSSLHKGVANRLEPDTRNTLRFIACQHHQCLVEVSCSVFSAGKNAFKMGDRTVDSMKERISILNASMI